MGPTAKMENKKLLQDLEEKYAVAHPAQAAKKPKSPK